MSVKIYIPADKVWEFFFENEARCTKEFVEVAANEDTGYAIYVTADEGYPMLSACHRDEAPEYEEGTISKDDCTATATKMYVRFLLPITVTCDKSTVKSNIATYDLDDELEEDARKDKMDEIYERDDDLLLSLCDFLKVVFEEEEGGGELLDTYGEAMVAQILDDFLDILSTNYCLDNIRRPTYMVDPETGVEFYTEYPYDPGIVDDDLSEAVKDALGEG